MAKFIDDLSIVQFTFKCPVNIFLEFCTYRTVYFWFFEGHLIENLYTNLVIKNNNYCIKTTKDRCKNLWLMVFDSCSTNGRISIAITQPWYTRLLLNTNVREPLLFNSRMQSPLYGRVTKKYDIYRNNNKKTPGIYGKFETVGTKKNFFEVFFFSFLD